MRAAHKRLASLDACGHSPRFQRRARFLMPQSNSPMSLAVCSARRRQTEKAHFCFLLSHPEHISSSQQTGIRSAGIPQYHLEIGQRASFDVELKPGQVSTVMTVGAETIPQLETESNAIGTVVDSARVQELPLNGRNFLQLALLSGGAVAPTTRSDAIGGPDRP